VVKRSKATRIQNAGGLEDEAPVAALQ
jgi:hypothetical protein